MLSRFPSLFGWIVLCVFTCSAVARSGGWEGFKLPVRYTMAAPVICFSPDREINARQRGVAVGTNAKGVTVFRGFENGGFHSQTDISGGFVVSVAMGYFNADTIPDIAVPNYFGGNFTIYLGTVGGGYVRGETYQVEGHCTWVAAGDFNEDGNTDIAAARNGSGQPVNLYIYIGNGDGTFSRFRTYPTQFDTPTEIIVANVNSDNHNDIAYSLSGPQAGALFVGHGDGTFGDPEVIAAIDSTRANADSPGFSLADIDGSGTIDWIGAEDFIDSIVVRRGDGTGRFAPDTALFLPHPHDVETADLNGDGRVDIIASNLDSIVCFLQDDHGAFSLATTVHSPGGAVKLLASDINNDGLPDLLFSSLDSSFSVAINRGESSADVGGHDESPFEETLLQNYPNPFNPTTTLSFNLPSRSFVTLKIYDALGREAASLISQELSAGNHTETWNAEAFPSGVYFYRLSARTISDGKASSFVETRKLILLR